MVDGLEGKRDPLRLFRALPGCQSFLSHNLRPAETERIFTTASNDDTGSIME